MSLQSNVCVVLAFTFVPSVLVVMHVKKVNRKERETLFGLKWMYPTVMRGFRLPLRSKRDLRSSRMLRNLDRCIYGIFGRACLSRPQGSSSTRILGLLVAWRPICLSRNVGSKQPFLIKWDMRVVLNISRNIIWNIYNNHTQLHILLDYNSSHMFRPNCRAIFSLKMAQELGRNM